MISSEKRPYIKLYINDFFCNSNLRMCSANSVGVLTFLMCVLHNSNEYGILRLGDCITPSDIDRKNVLYSRFAKKLTKQMPFTQNVIERGLLELSLYGIICLDNDGTLLLPRMVKDNALRQTRRNAANKRWENDNENPNFAYAKPMQNAMQNVMQNEMQMQDICNAQEKENKKEKENTRERTKESTKEKEINKEKEKKENVQEKKNFLFAPPAINDILEYCREKGYTFDAERFYDFYQSKNWYVGRNKMKDWKAAVRNWNRSEKERLQAKTKNLQNANDEWT